MIFTSFLDNKDAEATQKVTIEIRRAIRGPELLCRCTYVACSSDFISGNQAMKAKGRRSLPAYPPFAANATGIKAFIFPHQIRLKGHFVLPAVAEVVLVKKTPSWQNIWP
jgi:hypothetical protein